MQIESKAEHHASAFMGDKLINMLADLVLLHRWNFSCTYADPSRFEYPSFDTLTFTKPKDWWENRWSGNRISLSNFLNYSESMLLSSLTQSEEK